jgi:hypothetical protein
MSINLDHPMSCPIFYRCQWHISTPKFAHEFPSEIKQQLHTDQPRPKPSNDDLCQLTPARLAALSVFLHLPFLRQFLTAPRAGSGENNVLEQIIHVRNRLRCLPAYVA